ncbi:MAG: hypothetical protein IJ517_02460 [Alphaproteobacteria bacterium]|nr:hypothetical protein [Alphaproteobacteria bacterium]
MRKACIFILTLLVGVVDVNAAVRNEKTINRTTTSQRTTTTRPDTTTDKKSSARTTTNTISRTATARTTKTATAARTAKTVSTARSAISNTPARNIKTNNRANTLRSAIRPARATISLSTPQSNTFGTGYNTCRDAYFTCMDQFCGTANDAYRRCICSTKLSEIQSRERALAQAADQLQDFKNLNLEVINKTSAEVKAMLSASDGEFTQSITKDTSASASQLSGISDVLSKTKKKLLSTQGTLDIAGDINSIWATTDLMGGANISNLTGEALYNAVHAQCADLTIDKCPDTTTQTMVVTAYGMYIENDCSLLINGLDDKLNAANGTIRAAEREMNLARLENYNDHNSTSINDCVAKVRSDITSNLACGSDYVHCLDVTGRYLNYETGEPIYSADFFKLETQVSLSGDVLTNQTNRMLVAILNSKREFAKQSLDSCRDLSDQVWDEFMRQAIAEIYQNQQERIRQVKNECLDVVNNCYDQQTKSLKDFSNVKDQLLLGSRLELSEQMCSEKLEACSNLYGGGSHGMAELLTAMNAITSQQIADQCLTTLEEYVHEICAVPSSDTLHSYPYACRTYAPGDKMYASVQMCNIATQSVNSNSSSNNNADNTADKLLFDTYKCKANFKFTSCNTGYYMTINNVYNNTPTEGNDCSPCPVGKFCPGGTEPPMDLTGSGSDGTTPAACGTDYIGSLYHKVARYAMQACIRPSTPKAETMPQSVLQDINVVMDKIRVDMAKSLSAECERLGGIWVDTVWTDNKTDCYALDNENAPDKFSTPCTKNTANDTAAKITTCIRNKCKDDETMETTPDGLHDTTGQSQFKKFYNETSANTKWGFCATDTSKPIETTTSNQETNSDTTPTCTKGDEVIIVLRNRIDIEGDDDCCPNRESEDSVSHSAQEITAICGEFNSWPTDDNGNPTERATCTNNQNCVIDHYVSDDGDTFYPISGGPSATRCTGQMELYPHWRLLNIETE